MSNVLKLSDPFSVVLYLDRSWGVPSQQLYVQAAVPVLVLWIGHRGFLLNGAGEIIYKAQKCIRRSWVLGEVMVLHGTCMLYWHYPALSGKVSVTPHSLKQPGNLAIEVSSGGKKLFGHLKMQKLTPS